MTRNGGQAELPDDVHRGHARAKKTKMRASAAVLALVTLAGACSGAIQAEDSAAGPNIRNGEAAAQDFCVKVSQAAPTAASYRTLAREAPLDVRSDFSGVASGLASLEQVDDDKLPDASAALQEDPAYIDAISGVRRFLRHECGIGDGEEATGATSAEEAPSPGQDAGAGGPADVAESSGTGADDAKSPEEGSAAVPDAPGVPHAEVKDRMHEIFGSRLWGTNFESSRGNVFEFEGNISELVADEAVSACAELSLFLADHPGAAGTAELRLTDFPRSGEFKVLALNEAIRPGDAGRCYTP